MVYSYFLYLPHQIFHNLLIGENSFKIFEILSEFLWIFYKVLILISQKPILLIITRNSVLIWEILQSFSCINVANHMTLYKEVTRCGGARIFRTIWGLWGCGPWNLPAWKYRSSRLRVRGHRYIFQIFQEIYNFFL